MKTFVMVIMGLAALCAALVLNANTDPFGTQKFAHKLTEKNPSIAYAASSSIVDGYQLSAQTEIVWHEASVDKTVGKINNSLSDRDVSALCSTANDTVKGHESYQKWCL